MDACSVLHACGGQHAAGYTYFLLQEHSILRYLHSRTVVLLFHCSHLIQNDTYRERSKNSTVGGLIIIKSLPGDSHGPLVQLKPIAALSSCAIPLSACAPISTLTPPSPFIPCWAVSQVICDLSEEGQRSKVRAVSHA